MTVDYATLVLILIGLATGVFSGFFGIGGGVIIVPALVYLLGFSQHRAIGTSLAILLPPVGLGAVIRAPVRAHSQCGGSPHRRKP